jgi:3-hydroxybutyryl-CoA dehydrogenase
MNFMAETLEDYSISKSLKQKSTSLKKVGIVGCGVMGQDIALLASSCGIDVVFIDVSEEKVKEIFEGMGLKLDKIINRWGLTKSEKRAILSRIKGSADYKILNGCSIVIESLITSNMKDIVEVKQKVFKKIEEVVSREAIIATNSSTIVISELATALKYQDRALGIHFLSPALTVKIIEVTRCLQTSDESYKLVCKFANMLDREVISVGESPGSVSTRLIVSLINESCQVLMEGLSDVKHIDETMRSGYGLQLGPFEMADKIGLDKLIIWMDNLYNEFGERKYKTSPVIKKLVRAGHLGRKTGKGFYNYENGKIIKKKTEEEI